MAKSPENMTTEERLKRIRSLERKVADLEHRLDWAEREQAITDRWAQEAWAEVRRLHEVCTRHWEEKQAIRRAAGLDTEPSLVPLAKWNPGSREWEPEGCDPDCSRSGVDGTDIADPEKVWRCDGCGAVGTMDELDRTERHARNALVTTSGGPDAAGVS